MQTIIEIHDLTRTYQLGPVAVRALRGVSFTIERGEFVAIVGPSGSGKSTLMNLLGCLDTPSAGRYLLNGLSVAELDKNQLAAVRNRNIGFVFQQFNLLPRSAALLNVELPLLYQGLRDRQERRRRATEALAQVGLEDRLWHRPNELSGGQQQRVAIARALVTGPSLLLADEPTGNLDSKNGESVMDLLSELHQGGATICMVTHDSRFTRYAQRTVQLFDGRIVG
jgi:putative ABC transport system ATP-binding protein